MLSKYRVYCYDQLQSPAVTAGTNAVLIGAQNGLFPDMGFVVPGEMGGLWAGARKVCDGFFFAIDDVPLVGADAFEAQPVSSAFHYRMQKEKLHVVRRQYIPDGVSGCVIELTVENLRNVPRMVEVSFTVRTDMLTVAAARGDDGTELGRDVGEYDEQTQAFYARESRNPWHAVWGADSRSRVLQADLPHEVFGFGNTQGKGVNGRLFYRMRVGAQAQATMCLFVAGGFASRSQAEDALSELRAHADELLAAKEARVGALLEESAAMLPDEKLERCWNWARVYGDWLTRRLPRGGMGLCTDLPEHPSLFGEGYAQALGALLPLGGAARVQDMLRTLVRVSEEAQLAPGRLAKRISRSGRILQVGGVKESALFVSLVHRVLQWTGDVQFAEDMLPMTGLCISYLRRSTRNFEDVRDDLYQETLTALAGQAYILRLAGADGNPMVEQMEKLVKTEKAELPKDAPLAQLAAWHGHEGHVEQMIGCLLEMAGSGAPGLPGAVRSGENGVLIASRCAADLIWPMTESLFGLKPDAAGRTIAFAPHTPIGWDGWKVENIAVGQEKMTVESVRVSPSQCCYTIRMSEPGWQVIVCEDGEGKAYPVEGELKLTMGD
ncbi:MAG: hypothetical protein IJD94_01215 [Clostridia bacterium]|nr:hypothetical protein [Clostridia bacterium]